MQPTPHYTLAIVVYYIISYFIWRMYCIYVCFCCLWYALCWRPSISSFALWLQDYFPVFTSVSYLLKVHPKQKVSEFELFQPTELFYWSANETGIYIHSPIMERLQDLSLPVKSSQFLHFDDIFLRDLLAFPNLEWTDPYCKDIDSVLRWIFSKFYQS